MIFEVTGKQAADPAARFHSPQRSNSGRSKGCAIPRSYTASPRFLPSINVLGMMTRITTNACLFAEPPAIFAIDESCCYHPTLTHDVI
jgi:hypothetical protein